MLTFWQEALHYTLNYTLKYAASGNWVMLMDIFCVIDERIINFFFQRNHPFHVFLYLANMVTIQKAHIADAELLAGIAAKAFIETHEKGVPAADVTSYISGKLSIPAIEAELKDPGNIFHIIYYNGRAAGYSKIIFNKTYPAIESQAVTKLERIYLLKEFYDLKLGSALFVHNTDLSKKANQNGIWLYVWKINERALSFYKKAGFVIIGSEDFKISETHSNPNHIMYLKY
jgi:ribosomal protein S18 acetylase RimI-like enzyme